MAVGTTPFTVYEREDLSLTFTLDTGTFVGTEAIEFEIKANRSDPDPALYTGSLTPGAGAATATISFYIDLGAGTYYYGARRTDVGFRRQLAQAVVTVLESVNVG